MLQPTLLSSSWEGQVFYKNEGHKQSKMFTAVDQLPQTARKKLETSWASVFYEEFFRLLDEEVFSVLYSEKKLYVVKWFRTQSVVF